MGKLIFLNNILIVLFCLIFKSYAYSQDEPNIKFGEYSTDELKSTVYEADTNASAVVLYESGDAYFNNNFDVEFIKHVRIKILKKSGFNWGTVKIEYKSGKFKESIKDIKGVTAYLNEKGEIIIEELKKDDIFDAKLTKNYSCKSFSLPGLQPGCIIEYSYKKKSEYMSNFPKEWDFQKAIPVLWCEFITRVPAMYGFAIFEQKTQPFYIDTTEKYNFTYEFENSGSLYMNGFKKRMVMKNIPALRKEPFMKSENDLCAKVTYQLAAYNPPFSSSKVFLKTWKDLGNYLIDDDYFGGRLKGTRLMRQKVKELTDTITDKNQKLLSIYNFVKNSIVCDGHNDIYGYDFDDILEKKKGDEGDINLLLAGMLKESGIEVIPIILSTRDNGTVYKTYPILEQFNRVIVYAKIDKNEYVLDATDRQRPWFLLPEEVLNDEGLMIMEDNVGWVDINPTGKDLSAKVASVLIKSDGSIEGLMRRTDDDYSALSERHKMENKNNDEYIKGLLQTSKSGITGVSLKIKNKEEIEKPLVIESNISSSSYSQVSGNMMYVNPSFLGRIEDNPFKQDKRTFPIDYAYPIDHFYKVNITLPLGYELKESPKPVAVNLGDSKSGYTREITTKGNVLQFSTHFFINKIKFSPEEYSELKQFYDKVISFEAEPLVFQKLN